MGKLTDAEKIEAVRLYADGWTCRRIADEYEVTDESIRCLLKRRDIKRRTRKYTVNEAFFDAIKTESQAYWLGFLFADGNVSKSTVAIALNQRDKKHLQQFQRDLSSDAPLEYRASNKSWRARVHSDHMSQSLKQVGCVEKKSKVIQVPNIDESLQHHFFRGHFDGDGWITHRMHSGKWKSWQCGVASQSKNFLESMHKWVVKRISRDFGSLYQRGNGACWNLDFSGKRSVISFLGLIYEDATVFLGRKRKLYEEICSS